MRVIIKMFVLFHFLFPLRVLADVNAVSGRVVDQFGQPISLATVLIISSIDSSLKGSTFTDPEGIFEFQSIQFGKYFLRVSHLGYDDSVTDTFSYLGVVPLLEVVLSPVAKVLAKVTVKATKPFIQTQGGKIIVNAENSPLNSGANVLEMLSRLPGIKVDNDDHIAIKGKNSVTVMVNGKDQQLSGDDVALMLRNLPASSVDKIEIISNPSAKYEASGNGGIINIRLKRNKKSGLNGSLNTSYSQGIYHNSKSGLNLGYRKNKISFLTFYTHEDGEGVKNFDFQQNYFNGTVFLGGFRKDSRNIFKRVANLGNVDMDYALSTRTNLGISATFGESSTGIKGYTYSGAIDSLSYKQLSHFVTESLLPAKHSNVNININLRHQIDSNRVVLIDADIANFPSSAKQHYITNYFDDFKNDSTFPNVLSRLFYGSASDYTNVRSLKLDYETVILKDVSIGIGGKSSYVTSNYSLDNSSYVTYLVSQDSSQQQNRFRYTEGITGVYVNIVVDKERYEMELGLRFEHTFGSGKSSSALGDSTFTRNYAQPFPSFSLVKHVTEMHDVGISARRSITRPNYDQLNPNIRYIDPNSYVSGNPYLAPEIGFNVELSYLFNQKIHTSLSYNYSAFPIVEVSFPNSKGNKLLIFTSQNLTYRSWSGVNSDFQFSLAKWWNSLISLNLGYMQYNGNLAGSVPNTSSFTGSLYVNSIYVFSDGWQAEFGANLFSAQVVGYTKVSSRYIANCGLQRALFDKKFQIKLSLTDIFWSDGAHTTTEMLGYRDDIVSRSDTRRISLGLTWNFGSMKPIKRHVGGAEEEIRRSGS